MHVEIGWKYSKGMRAGDWERGGIRDLDPHKYEDWGESVYSYTYDGFTIEHEKRTGSGTYCYEFDSR